MRPGELALIGIGSVMVGFMLAAAPLVNILFGWWASPLLILGGILAIFSSILFAVWEAFRISTRFLICLFFREEEQGSPAIRHSVLNTKIWQLLGGGHCPAPIRHLGRCFLIIFLTTGMVIQAVPGFASTPLNHNYPTWKKLLSLSVQDGRVDYAATKGSTKLLDYFIHCLQSVSRAEYNRWSREQKIAFWINGYNAAVIKLVGDHYPPGKKFGWKTFTFPENSIQQIPKVWNRKVIEVFGRTVSLNQIEHEILRKEFQEPRIHFALVCASLGCPVLRNEPYQGNKLDAQLDEQVGNFLADSRKARYDEATDTLYLSPIFKWFRKDFERTGGVIAFVKTHWPNETKEKISEKTKIEWLDYDWSLNERRSP